jgi:hypothetical protein
VYGFAKSQRANIDDDEEEQFKEAAKHVLALTERQLAELLKTRRFYKGEKRMSKKYRSDATAAIHETMEALRDIGAH